MVIFWSRFALMFGRIWQGEAAVGAHVAAQCSIYKVHNYMYSTCTRLRLINARTFSVPPPATPPGARRGGRGGGASEPTAMIATNQTLPPRSLCTAARAARRKRSEKDAQTGTERGRRQQNGPGRSPQSFWKDEVLVPGQETAELPVVAAPRQKAQHVRWPYMYGEPLILSARSRFIPFVEGAPTRCCRGKRDNELSPVSPGAECVQNGLPRTDSSSLARPLEVSAPRARPSAAPPCGGTVRAPVRQCPVHT